MSDENDGAGLRFFLGKLSASWGCEILRRKILATESWQLHQRCKNLLYYTYLFIKKFCMEKTFSIKEILGVGWDQFKKQWKFLVPFALATIILVVLMQILFGAESSFVIALIGILVMMLVQALIKIAWTTITLDIVDGKTAGWADAKTNVHLWWKFVLGNILYGIIVNIGFLLLIIPGIYFATKYQFFTFALIDNKDLGIWDAFKESARVTNGAKWKLFGLWFVFLGVAVLGFLALGVGILVAAIVIAIAMAAVYRKLSTQTASPEKQTVEMDDIEVSEE